MLTSSNNKSSYGYQIGIIGILFFIFGFVTWLNGTLIPFLKLTCELKTDTQSFLVTFAFFMAYFFLAIPSSWILERIGYKYGMALGLAVMALGSLLFIPAANARSFPLFLTGLFVQGMGLALLQTASNPYISIIGPLETAATRISIMGICNKVAGALAPLILGSILLGNATNIQQQLESTTTAVDKLPLLAELSNRIIMPYLFLTGILLALSFMIYKSNLPEIAENTEGGLANDDKGFVALKKSIFDIPHVWLGALCIFMYVGAEVMAGDLIGFYGKKLGFALDQTRFFTTFTLIAMLIGYVIGIVAIPKYISQQTALWVSAVLGIALTVGAYFTEGVVSVGFVAALGIANAPMWPAIFPLGINKLGRFTKLGSALLVMGIAGGAFIPQLYGHLTDAHVWDFKLGFLITMIICYAYILWFGQRGHKIGLS